MPLQTSIPYSLNGIPVNPRRGRIHNSCESPRNPLKGTPQKRVQYPFLSENPPPIFNKNQIWTPGKWRCTLSAALNAAFATLRAAHNTELRVPSLQHSRCQARLLLPPADAKRWGDDYAFGALHANYAVGSEVQ